MSRTLTRHSPRLSGRLRLKCFLYALKTEQAVHLHRTTPNLINSRPASPHRRSRCWRGLGFLGPCALRGPRRWPAHGQK